LSLSIASGDAEETEDTDFSLMVCWKFWADYDILFSTHCQELTESVGTSWWLVTAIHEGDGLIFCE